MNKRYEKLKVTEGTYVPPAVSDYPEEEPYAGMYKPVYNRPFPKVDANYPYVNDTWQNRLGIWFGYHIVRPIMGHVLRVKYGLRWKVEGQEKWSRCSWTIRKWMKQYDLSHGAITIANHCYRHDCASVLTSFSGSHHMRIPMFAPNFRTKDQFFLRIIGGVPIPAPEDGLSAMKAFNAAFDEFDRRGYWFHIFPEAKRWDWYKPLRPFQKGAFTMSYKYNKPIIPFAITYRPRTGIYRLLGPQDEPLTQVIVGAPIYPDTTAPRAGETDRLLNLTHQTICRLAGIEHNTWPSSL